MISFSRSLIRIKHPVPYPLHPLLARITQPADQTVIKNFSLDRLFTLHKLTSAQTVPLTSNPPNPAHPREPPAGLIHLPFAPQTLHVPLGLSPPLRPMSFAPPSSRTSTQFARQSFYRIGWFAFGTASTLGADFVLPSRPPPSPTPLFPSSQRFSPPRGFHSACPRFRGPERSPKARSSPSREGPRPAEPLPARAIPASMTLHERALSPPLSRGHSATASLSLWLLPFGGLAFRFRTAWRDLGALVYRSEGRDGILPDSRLPGPWPWALGAEAQCRCGFRAPSPGTLHCAGGSSALSDTK